MLMKNIHIIQNYIATNNTLRRSVIVVLRLYLGMALVYSVLTRTYNRMDPRLYSLYLPS
jgi:hypothetical protein